MKRARIFTSLLLASLIVFAQVAVAFAAPKSGNSGVVSGTVLEVTLNTDVITGVITVLVTVKDELGGTQTVRISEETAISLGLVTSDVDGNPIIVDPLPGSIEIDPSTVIPDEQPRHPVASALATFFSDISGLDDNAIMDARANGNGFGVIVQALFLTEKLGGDVTIFQEILEAKKDNDFSDFPLDDGTIPTSWGQFRKAIADKHLGIVMSHNHGNNSNDGTSNNGNSDGNGDGNGNGNPNKP